VNLLLLVAEVGAQTVAGGGVGALVAGGLAVREVRKRRRATRESLKQKAMAAHAAFEKSHPVPFTRQQRELAILQRYQALCKAKGLTP
jgi:hypothetical protein